MTQIGLSVFMALACPGQSARAEIAAPQEWGKDFAPTPDELDYQSIWARREMAAQGSSPPALPQQPLDEEERVPRPPADGFAPRVWPGPRRPEHLLPALPLPLVSPPGPKGMVPVTLELEVADPGEYRDALAELTKSSGFRMDSRFAPIWNALARPRRMAVRGWMKAARFTDVVRLSRLRRLEVGAPAPSVEDRGTALLIGLALPQSLPPDEFLSASLERLKVRADFESKRVIGRVILSGSKAPVIVVLGRVPVRNIGRVLADPSVVKVSPFQVGLGALLSSLRNRRSEAGVWASTLEHPVLMLIACLFFFCARALKRPPQRKHLKRPKLFV